MLENLKENKWNGGMKTMGGTSVRRQIVQTNVNIVHMNKDIIDMSKELMKINWANGFNLKEEKRLIPNTIPNPEIKNNNTTINNESQTVLEINSDVVKMNKDILQMNKDIIEMNKSQHHSNNTSNYTNIKIVNEFTKTEKFDNCEKENREPKTENKVRKLIIKQDFQGENNQESREQLEVHKTLKSKIFQQKNNDTKTEETKEEQKEDIKKNVEIILRNKNSSNKTLMDIVKDKQEGDIYIVNTDNELTDIIKKTFEGHGCQVSVSQLEKDLIALYILLNKKISIKKLRKLIEKGNKFGLQFFLTKTGMTSSLLTKVHQIFKW